MSTEHPNQARLGISRWRSILLLAASLLAMMPAAANPVITLGVLAFRGPTHAIERWQPTVDYLNNTILGYEFRLLPLDLYAMHDALENNKVSFILTNPGNYVELESKFAVTRIATLRSQSEGDSTAPIQSAIIVRSQRDDLNTYSQLAGKSLLIVSDRAFGGFQIAWHEMALHDIDPYDDLASITHSGFPQDQIVHAVINGEIDVGIVRSCVLESMHKNGLINLDDIRVLGQENYPDSPCLSSTPAYPDWPIAKSAQTPDGLAKQVTMALLALQPDDPAALAGNYSGWTIPVDYQTVHTLFQDLKIGPYAWMQKTTIEEFWEQNWQWLIILLIALGWWLWHVFRIEKLVRTRTSQLSKANKRLQQEIEDRRHAEDQLCRQQEEFAHVARISTAGELAKGIAHELNQPLSAIASYAQGCEWRIQSGKITADEMIDVTQRVHSQAERAAAIIERLRTFLRKGEVRRSPISINPVVREALALFSPEAKKNQVGLSVSYTENLPPVSAESIQLQQVIINLLRNAVDAMKQSEGSHRRIDLITRRGDEGTVVIDIRDYGPGIDIGNPGQLFDPFFTTKKDGMGIGLALSQSIIESFDGQIRVHPNSHPGARFIIELPQCKQDEDETG